MIRASLTLGLYLLLTAAYAQPVLSDDDLPVAGTMYVYHDVPYVKAGPGGGSMRWDQTALPVGTLLPYQWTTSDVAPGAGAFPAHSLVLNIPGEPALYYVETDSTFLWAGAYSDTALLRFDPPLRTFRFPLGIGDAWADSGIVAVTGAGRIAIRQVIHTVKADAWGTLIMPYGPIQNTIRVRSELVLRDPAHPSSPVGARCGTNGTVTARRCPC